MFVLLYAIILAPRFYESICNSGLRSLLPSLLLFLKSRMNHLLFFREPVVKLYMFVYVSIIFTFVPCILVSSELLKSTILLYILILFLRQSLVHSLVNKWLWYLYLCFMEIIIWLVGLLVQTSQSISFELPSLTLWRRNYYFFLILAHPVYKMWIIQKPNKLALWNKLHFEEKKTESIEHV